MKCLLDTHVFFWAAFQDEKLSARSKSILENPSNEILVSRASLLELAIKHKVGKLPELKVDLAAVIEEVTKAGFVPLPIKDEHLIAYFNCPYFSNDHRDPFDRLLLVTADVEKAAFITKDEKFNAYSERVNIIW